MLVLGPEHPDTLVSRNNLTIGYRAQMAALGEALEQHRAVALSGGAGTGKGRQAGLAPLLGVPIEGRRDEEVAGEREVKLALRKTLFKYRLHQDQELFDRTYAYIREYY